jgi:hypothetical protein
MSQCHLNYQMRLWHPDAILLILFLHLLKPGVVPTYFLEGRIEMAIEVLRKAELEVILD